MIMVTINNLDNSPLKIDFALDSYLIIYFEYLNKKIKKIIIIIFL